MAMYGRVSPLLCLYWRCERRAPAPGASEPESSGHGRQFTSIQKILIRNMQSWGWAGPYRWHCRDGILHFKSSIMARHYTHLWHAWHVWVYSYMYGRVPTGQNTSSMHDTLLWSIYSDRNFTPNTGVVSTCSQWKAVQNMTKYLTTIPNSREQCIGLLDCTLGQSQGSREQLSTNLLLSWNKLFIDATGTYRTTVYWMKCIQYAI
jgi:hypothetical protein